MSLQAVQAQAGHRNIESTRIYLHMSDEHTPQPTTRDLSADQPVSTSTFALFQVRNTGLLNQKTKKGDLAS